MMRERLLKSFVGNQKTPARPIYVRNRRNT